MHRIPTLPRPLTVMLSVVPVLVLGWCMLDGTVSAEQPDSDQPSVVPSEHFQQQVLPLLQTHCFGCHGPKEQEADVRLDTLSRDLVSDRNGSDTWHDALNALNRGEMPPEDAKGLSSDQRATLVDWITGELTRARQARESTGGQVVMRRLNRVEYQNTMRDLLGIDLDFAKDLPPDPLSRDGFSNNGASLKMSAMQLECYLESARGALERAIVEGPAPPVFENRFEETVNDKGKGNWTNRLGRSGVFVARIPKFPDEGEFVIRVRARAELAENAPLPVMQLTLGYRADVSAPSRIVGTADVGQTQVQEFVFRGRLEEFPIQSRTQSKYPGMLIWIRNAYSDGKPPLKPVSVQEEVPGKKKKRKRTVYPEDPEFPKIVIESIEFKAPVFVQWPPKHHTRIVADRPKDTEQERTVARQSLHNFMRRAFRREVLPSELETYLKYYDQVRPSADGFESAMRDVIAMVLISPEFLYLSEPKMDRNRLRDSELAARLSYFLWSTTPDDQLLQLGIEGKLSDPATLRQEVDRMLEDERSARFADQFSSQWLDLAGIDRVAVNPEFYPQFDNAIKADMRREPQQYFAHVVQHDLSALTLLDSDFMILNQTLAKHYGVSGPRGTSFERVSLQPESRRGGLLTQAAVLLANSSGEDSHPIKRGVWIRERILDDPPAPPPPDVPDLNQELPDLAALPLKEQLRQHRENESCAACHRGIDPWGVALEGFDAIGLTREVIRRAHPKRNRAFVEHPVDAASVLPDGSRVDGAQQLKDYLIANQSHAFARAFVSKMLAYATGRSLDFGDEQAVDEMTRQFIASEYRIKELIRMIAACDTFRQG